MRASERLKRLLLASASATLLTLSATAAWADDPVPASEPDATAPGDAAAPADTADTASPNTAGAEIVTVTARRRSESLFEVPATVTAVGGDTLRENGIDDIKSMIALIPNAVVPQDPQNFNTFINIRGIRQVDAQAEPNFGLYRNGIFAGGQRANLGAQVDIERLEVLRGPQGGLYGRNAVGGAVNIVYATPGDEMEGYIAARAGRYQRFDIEGAVTLPVSENFAVRLAGWSFNQEEGEIYNITLDEEIDAFSDSGGRLTARANLSDKVTVVWTAEYQDTEGPSGRTYAPNGVANFITQSPGETYRTVRRDTPSESATEQLYLSQDITFESSAGTFNLLAAVRDYELTSTEDQDYTDIGPLDAPLALMQRLDRNETIDNRYVELIWVSRDDQRLTWIAGVSYFEEEFGFNRQFTTTVDFDTLSDPVFGSIACIGLLGDPSCPGVPGGPSIPFTTSPFPAIGLRTGVAGFPGNTSIETEALSVFGDFTFEVNDKFDINASLRYTRDEKTLDYHQFLIPTDALSDPYLEALFANVVPSFSLATTSEFENWSPSVGYTYRHSDNATFYGLINTGFRAGGFNTTSTTPALIPYDQEEATNYELGAKTLWNDGALGANFAIFYMEQSNLALAQSDPFAPPQFNFSYLANIGDARTYGVEAEFFARLNDWLTGAASVGWLDAEFTSGSSFGTSIVGRPLPNTRDWTFNVRLDAEYPLGGDVYLVSAINWRVEIGGVQSSDFTVPYDDLNKLDARLGLEVGRFRIVGFIDNAFDDQVVEFLFANGAVAPNYGRTYGVEISADF